MLKVSESLFYLRHHVFVTSYLCEDELTSGGRCHKTQVLHENQHGSGSEGGGVQFDLRKLSNDQQAHTSNL